MTSGALAEPTSVVSFGSRAVPDLALREGIARCQRDAADLPIAACVEQHQVPRWRLLNEAARRWAPDAPLRREIESRVLAERLAESWLEQATADEPEVSQYLREHEAAWKTPERLRLFRILSGTREEALGLLSKLAEQVPAEFRAAARQVSLDRASHERGGDLGFVAADGTTDVPGQKVDPVLFSAAKAVPDGAFVPEPVVEGAHFAVVWRRGSLPARVLPEVEARAWASARVREQKARKQLDALLAERPVTPHVDLLARFRRPECHIFTH